MAKRRVLRCVLNVRDETGRDAKFYSLTRSGRKQLAVERLNWKRLAEAIALVLRTAE